MKHRWNKLMLAALLTMLLGAAVGLVHAQQGVTWGVKFYDNAFLAGHPVAQTQVGNIAFYWGENAPNPNVPADRFTARFNTVAFFPGGTYRFYVLADDGVRLFIDDTRLVVDTLETPRIGEIVTVDVALSAGNHKLQLDYREITEIAYVYLDWDNVLNADGPTFSLPSVPPDIPPSPGGIWTAEYYTNPDLAGSPIAILSEPTPSRNWGTDAPLPNMPADNFSVRWRSTPTLEGTYQISVRADDGVRVSVNGNTIINEWHPATGQTYTAQFSVPRGVHTIIVEFYEGVGVASLDYNMTRATYTQPTPPPPAPPPPGFGGWVAQYYNNLSFSGTPVTVAESSPTHYWGTGAPVGGVGPDNWTARWTTTQYLNAGNYTVTARSDDGVRVYVDGRLVIDEWRLSTGSQTYRAVVPLNAGTHTFIVEYFEATGNAFLEYNLIAGGVVQPTPAPPPQQGPYLIVDTGRLNVRSAPGLYGEILTKIDRGGIYPILGRNSDASWWLINVNGINGWVSAPYVDVFNTQGVPVVDSGTNPPADVPTGYTLTTTANLNLRGGPGLNNPVLYVIPRGQTADILGRTGDLSWWKVSYSGLTGWVSGRFVRLQPGIDLNRVPVLAV